METASRSSLQAASSLYGSLLREVSGPNGTWCVHSTSRARIARQLLEQTGWTVRELMDAALRADPEAGEVLHVRVRPDEDTQALASTLARFSRAGAQVKMYPVGIIH